MKIGKSESEIDAEKLLECRKIVRNIMNFGITEKQKIHLIYLISLEVENRETMEFLVEAVKKSKNLNENNKFNLTDQDNEYNKDNDKKSKLLDI
jgi:hypothetical protein